MLASIFNATPSLSARLLAIGVLVFATNVIDASAEPLEASVTEGCSANVSPPTPNSRALPNAVKVAPPTTGAYAGLYTLPPEMREYRQFVEKAGSPPPIVFSGQNWIRDDDFGKDNPRLDKLTERHPESDEGLTSLQFAEQLADQGSVLAIAWAAYCCDVSSWQLLMGLDEAWNIFTRILNDEFDNYIRTVAREIKAFNRPIMITLTVEYNSQAIFMFGEDGTSPITGVSNICNEYGDPAWPDGPERIRDFYMHVIDIFRDEGVANVTWFMFASSNYVDDDPDEDVWLHPKYFYPGDAYIDWVGQSGYFIDPATNHGIEDARDFHGAVKAGYEAWGTVTQRPFFIPEFGAMSDGNESRAALIRDVFQNILPTYPRIKAITFGDSQLFEAYFSLPRLGNVGDEITAWQDAVEKNPYYVKKVILKGPE